MAAAKREPNTSITLPSGVVVHFWDEVGVDGMPQQRRYAYGEDWQSAERFPSISTIASVYDKPAIYPWYARTAIEGIAALGIDASGLSAEAIAARLREHRLDPDSVKDDAGKRGNAAHDVLLHLLRDGVIPRPMDHAPEFRPYLAAGASFVIAHRPEIIEAEQIVCSTEHRFAGRFDLLARFPDGRIGRIDFKTITDWKYTRPRVDGSCDLLPPYDENLYQLAGYEIGAVESGFQESDFQAVVRLGPDGKFDLTESWAAPEHFLGCLAAYNNAKGLRAARKAVKPQAVLAV